MVNKQPEALRLADAYEATGLSGHIKAAAELRRLHALNAELLEALQTIMRMNVKGHALEDRLQFTQIGREILEKANGAIRRCTHA